MTESRRGSKVTGRYPLTIGRRRSTSTRPRTDVRTSVGQWTRRVLPRISEELMAAYRSSGDLHHLRLRDLPSKQRTIGILNDLMTILFPSWSGDSSLAEAGGERLLGNALNSLYTRLGEEIVRSLRYSQGGEDETSVEGVRERARGIVEALLRQLPVMKRRLSADVQAAYRGRPCRQELGGDRPQLPLPLRRCHVSYRSRALRTGGPDNPANHERACSFVDRCGYPSRREDRRELLHRPRNRRGHR